MAIRACQKREPENSRLGGWGARDRTWDDGTKARCLTAWLRPNSRPFWKGGNLVRKAYRFQPSGISTDSHFNRRGRLAQSPAINAAMQPVLSPAERIGLSGA